MARDLAYYHHTTNFAIATEILADPEASIREQVLARRLRGKAEAKCAWCDDHKNFKHKYD